MECVSNGVVGATLIPLTFYSCNFLFLHYFIESLSEEFHYKNEKIERHRASLSYPSSRRE
jgi:hypothetical protein